MCVLCVQKGGQASASFVRARTLYLAISERIHRGRSHDEIDLHKTADNLLRYCQLY